jgi:hypothetical protein
MSRGVGSGGRKKAAVRGLGQESKEGSSLRGGVPAPLKKSPPSFGGRGIQRSFYKNHIDEYKKSEESVSMAGLNLPGKCIML